MGRETRKKAGGKEEFRQKSRNKAFINKEKRD